LFTLNARLMRLSFNYFFDFISMRVSALMGMRAAMPSDFA